MKLAVVTCGLAPVPSTSSQTIPPIVQRNEASTNAISLKPNGRRPITSTRRSFSRIACQTWPGRGRDGVAHDEEDDDRVAEREPVEVLRVQDADEEVGQRIGVEAEALLPAGQLIRVLLHEHLAGLRERERHHREGDPADTQADRAEQQRHEDPGDRGHRDGLPQRPLPLRQRDRRQVDAEREVERVPEREQPREAEEEVVGERDPGEEEAEREQAERPGAVERAAEDDGNVERKLSARRARTATSTSGTTSVTQPGSMRHLRGKPSGLSRRTTASRSTTARSPRPLEA